MVNTPDGDSVSLLGEVLLVLNTSNVSAFSSGNSLEFHFEFVNRLPDPQDTPGTSITTNKPVNNKIFSVGGTEESIRLDAVLYDNGVDVSNGTLQEAESNNNLSDPRFSNSDVTTRFEQKIWLKEYVNFSDLQADWKLYGYDFTDRVNNGDGIPVFITKVDPQPDPNRPLSIPVTVNMLVGDRLG